MRVIIAGSRTITDYRLVEAAVKASGFDVTEVVSGKARGVDTLGERWAYENDVDMTGFYADWGKHGPSAGPIRNREMAEYAKAGPGGGALVAVHSANSPGTRSMIEIATKMGLKVYVVNAGKE